MEVYSSRDFYSFDILNDDFRNNRIFIKTNNVWTNDKNYNIKVYDRYPTVLIFANTIVIFVHGGFEYASELSNYNTDLSSVTVQYNYASAPYYGIIMLPHSFIGTYPKLTVISNTNFETYFEGRT